LGDERAPTKTHDQSAEVDGCVVAAYRKEFSDGLWDWYLVEPVPEIRRAELPVFTEDANDVKQFFHVWEDQIGGLPAYLVELAAVNDCSRNSFVDFRYFKKVTEGASCHVAMCDPVK